MTCVCKTPCSTKTCTPPSTVCYAYADLYGLACTDDALPSGKLKAMKDAFSAEPKSVVSYYDLLSLVVNCNVHRQRVLIALYVSRKEFGQLETAVFF